MITQKCLCLRLLIFMIAAGGAISANASEPSAVKSVPTEKESASKGDRIEAYLGEAGPKRYMRLHYRISRNFRNWTDFAERIGDTGDAFTLFVLKRSKFLDQLPLEKQEFRKQLIKRIERQRGANPDQIRVEEVGFLVKNAIDREDQYCNPIQYFMINWLHQQFQNQSSQPQMRKRLEELRAELQKLPKADPEDDDFMPETRILRFLDGVLKSDKNPATGKN